ncbi:MAG: alanine racemase [Spirochaetota bacterium]|nr:alanine racemase [Spirochaetota bacterium]
MNKYSLVKENSKTYLEIDIGAIERNIRIIKEIVGADRKILLAVKADGYGHGAIQISRFVEESGLVDILGVASHEEGIELRRAGISLPILVLGLILPYKENIGTILDYDLTQTVADYPLSEQISKEAKSRNKSAKLHLKIDTGMGRIGCKHENSVMIAKSINHLESIILEGVFSHLPVSDIIDSEFTINQIKIFNNIIKELEIEKIDVKYKHIANSAAILNYPESLFNMARPGIMAYGYYPVKNNNNKKIDLTPSMSLKSYIIFSKRVKKGTSLSYGLTYTAERDSNIATIPIGYGCGYSRFLSNKGQIIINNKIYPVVGRVCMDQILINTGDDEYAPGEEVIVFGKEGITVETLADWIGTIPYEIICSISRNIKRKYLFP